MPDVFLFPGEANPKDVRLRNPTLNGDVVSGTAPAATGSIVDAATFADAVSGRAVDSNPSVVTGGQIRSWLQSRGPKRTGHTGVTAPVYAPSGSPTGSVVESWSIAPATIASPVETRLVAVSTARARDARRRHSIVRAPAPPVVNVDVVSGSASPSGSIVEAWSVLSLSQMTIAVRRASDLLKRKARVRYQHRLTANAGIVFLTDVVSGSASPTGSVVESWSVLSLQQMTVKAVLAVDRVKRKVRVRYQHRLTANAGITTISDAPTGSASPSGTIVEAKIGTDAVLGSASPTGTIVESSSVLTLAQMTILVRRAVDLLKRKARVRYQHRLTFNAGISTTGDFPTGSASPTGAVVESKTGSDAVSGTAGPSGSATDLLSHASSPSGTASASGTNSELRIGSDAVTGAASASGSTSDAGTGGDSVSGASSPSGALVELRIGTDAVTGSAQPSGSVVESAFRGFADTPSGSASPSGAATDAFTATAALSGTAHPSGSLSDDYQPPIPEGPVGGVGGVPEGVRLSRLKTPPKAKLYLDTVNGYASPIGYVTESCIVMPRIATQWVDSEEDELMLLGLL